LPYHPLYIFLAIGFGSITLSWMNDSGFWVVQRLSGFTEKEMLKTWTVMLTAISVAGLLQVLVMAEVLPMKPVPAQKTSQVSSVPALGSEALDELRLHRRK
jgi:GntP family gluconate:H+ symporter